MPGIKNKRGRCDPPRLSDFVLSEYEADKLKSEECLYELSYETVFIREEALDEIDDVCHCFLSFPKYTEVCLRTAF